MNLGTGVENPSASDPKPTLVCHLTTHKGEHAITIGYATRFWLTKRRTRSRCFDCGSTSRLIIEAPGYSVYTPVFFAYHSYSRWLSRSSPDPCVVTCGLVRESVLGLGNQLRV